MVYAPFCDWLAGCDWVDVIDKAHVTTSGTAESFIGAIHITRTWYAHQIIALTPFKLIQQAFFVCAEEGHQDGSLRLCKSD